MCGQGDAVNFSTFHTSIMKGQVERPEVRRKAQGARIKVKGKTRLRAKS